MLFLLDANVRTVKWNGIPLHEASSAIVKEETNGDFYLTVHYPITDSGIYQLIKEDMLIKAPTPVLGAQLFRIKKPIENDDSLDITAYHISDDVMQRSITPVSVVGQGCAMALSQMVQNAKTGLGDFSFTSDIMDNRTFNTTETETLYSVLMDGKHSIVGTWEGELVRDNFALSIKRSRGADRGVVITTHKNLKSYQRTKNSQGVVTRIHACSTFKPDGAEDEVTLRVTVDSPLINSYPYINEKEYENNNAETVEDLRKWAEAKFTNEGIDKVSDAIEIEAYELDGQVVHLGDTVNLKSRKHSADLYKKAIAYDFNALTEEYISITFDDKPGVGGSGVSSGLSNAADAILGVSSTAQDVAIERAVKNANAAFDAAFNKGKEAIEDGIEKAKAEAEKITGEIALKINTVIEDVENLEKQIADSDANSDKLLEEFEKQLDAFNEKFDNIDLSLSDDQITAALSKAGFDKATLNDLKKMASTNSDTLETVVDMIGSDGRTIYSRNRATVTEGIIPLGTESLSVGHNGDGFEVGESYVISWEAVCNPYASSEVVLSFDTSRMFGVTAKLVPSNPLYPTNTADVTEASKTIYAVYHDTYTLTVEGDWYQSVTLPGQVVDGPKTITVPLAFKTVADGNLTDKYIGEWAETPEIILDGGN